MNRNAIWLLIAIIAMIFCLTVWPTIYRYDQIRPTEGVTYPVRMNRISGYTEMFIGSKWRGEAKRQIRNESRKACEIPQTELSSLTGHGGFNDRGRFSASIYNGTEWVITGITFRITILGVDYLSVKDTTVSVPMRLYRSDGFEIQPMMAQDNIEVVVDGATWMHGLEWGIESAKGYRE